MGGNESVWGHSIVGGRGRMKEWTRKSIQKLSLGYSVTITGRVFSLRPKFFWPPLKMDLQVDGQRPKGQVIANRLSEREANKLFLNEVSK